MSDAKYTKGPWIAYTDVKEPVINSLGAAYEPQIALLSEIEGESEANAHLIAAAPEMFEALESALEYLKEDDEAFGLVVSALAKAKGEQ